jgi:murein DD-endopeptidase MepM/ murein hydrolase activator NlpD
MGFSTIYGHNSQLLVSEGDKVNAGAVLALSGNSGRSTGPHLHYEIRLNDTAVDPLKYLDTDVPSAVQK